MNGTPMLNDRLLDMLADDALVGLDDQDRAIFDELLAEADLEDVSEAGLDRAAGALCLGMLDVDDEPMPESLRDRIVKSGMALTENAESGTQDQDVRPVATIGPESETGTSSGFRLWGGWAAAAACLVLALFGWALRGPQAVPEVALSERVDRLVSEAPDLVSGDWILNDDQWGEVTGRVVWSQSRQEGYMVFSGLRENDPKAEQYQLWVFQDDPSVEATPIHGGIFDSAGSGELIVPITTPVSPKTTPVAFAVTVEDPGGVWVSDRSRLPVLALAK